MMTPIAVLLLALAPANDPPELELASALARRGWVDLADELCSRLETLPGTPLVQAEVASARARQQSDAAAAARTLDEAIRKLGTTLSPEGLLTAGGLRVQKARLLNDPASWEEARAFYGSAVADLEKRAGAGEALLDAKLELAKTTAELARSVVGDEPRKRKRLEEAVHLLLDFQLETGTIPVAFEAVFEEGRARADLKDYARAERCFRSVLAVNRKGPAAEYLSSLHDGAFLSLLGVLSASGKAAEAIKSADLFLKDGTRAKTPMGLAVQLAKAEAMAAAGNRAGAVLAAQAVAAADPAGAAGTGARDRIREWTRAGGATAAQLLLIADGLMDGGLYQEALVDLRRCVEVCADAADRAKHEPLASYRRGECFRSLKREAEASLAYQDVFRKYPTHELAPRAAFEAVRALIRSAAGTRDRRDEEQQEALLKEIKERGVQGSNADFFTFLEAESLERKSAWKAAADLYQKVGEGSEVYADAIVSAAHCLRRDVEAKGDPKGLAGAEKLLRLAVARLEKAANPKLRVVAQYELATLLLASNPREALDLVLRCAAQLPPESEMLPRLGEMEVRARLGAGELAGASARLDVLLADPAGGAAALRAARRVATALEASDAAKSARYYHAWLERAATEDTSPGDVKATADGLYRVARRLNEFDEKTVSALDLRGRPVVQRAVWADAEQAQLRLLARKDLSAAERRSAQALLISCGSLSAVSADDWTRVKTHAEALIGEYQLEGPNGLNPAVLVKEGWLAGLYLEYGHALVQLGKAGRKFQFGNALTVFSRMVDVTERGSEPWWVSRMMQIRIYFERGEGNDLAVASSALSTLSVSFPDFDAGKYGIKPLLLELGAQIRAVEGKKR
jgi:tetratricopeptide (TPR) repeat protein